MRSQCAWAGGQNTGDTPDPDESQNTSQNTNEYKALPRTLYYFRAEVAQYEIDNGINLMDRVFTEDRDRIIKELGINTGLQRVDSVMIRANTKRLNRVMLFHKVLSNLVKECETFGIPIPQNATNLLTRDEDGFAYRLSREEYTTKTIEIGETIYHILTANVFNGGFRRSKSYRQALRLLREQCTIEKSNEKGKLTLKEGKEVKSSSMQTPVDEDATYRLKNKNGHIGYKAQAVETCDKNNAMQVITSIEVAPNNKDDAEILEGQIKRLKEETDLHTQIGDGAYVSDGVRKECGEKVKLVTSAIRGVDIEKIKGQMSIEEFAKDATGKYISCPEGQKVRSEKHFKDGRVKLNFDAKICSKCPKKGQCPVQVSKRQSHLVIDDKRLWFEQMKEILSTGEWETLAGLRPAVEGLMSMLKPKYLSGRILSRGLERVKNKMISRAISINFRRYTCLPRKRDRQMGYIREKLACCAKFSYNFLRFCYEEVATRKTSWVV